MTNKVRHVLGISGGKDSAALAIYMKLYYPEIEFEYYFTDTGKELDETYDLINELEVFLGKKIERLETISHKNPFDHYLDIYNGFLPSSMARWCTKKLKLEPFEKWVGNDPVISYVAIRGDEDREGYVSTKSNIQSIFPFRRQMWSIEVINKVLHNSSISKAVSLYKKYAGKQDISRLIEILEQPQSKKYLFSQKLNDLLNVDVIAFNKVVFEYFKDSDLPIASLEDYPLLKNEDVVVKDDVFRLFKENGIKVPDYYTPVEFEVDGKTGTYNRSRSGCYFCFYQRKIEWIWLYERHRDLFDLALSYEKDGYSWMDSERLEDIIKPERINQIKREHLAKIKNKLNKPQSNKLIDILEEDSVDCVNCFI